MTEVALDVVMVRRTVAKRTGWPARLAQWFTDWVATDEPEADPTATFSARDWADLPTHHPADEG